MIYTGELLISPPMMFLLKKHHGTLNCKVVDT